MKSFSQFLQESYLSEEEAEQLRLLKRDNKTAYNLRKNVGNRGIAADPTPTPASRRFSAAAPEAPKESPGQQVIRQTPKPPTTKALIPGKEGGPLAGRETNPQAPPESMMKGAYDAANKPTTTAKPSSAKTSATPKPRTTAYRNAGLGRETVKIPTSPASTSSSARREFTPEREAEIRRERAAAKKAREAAYDAKQSPGKLATRSSSSLSTQAKPSSSAIVPAGKQPSGPKVRGGFGRLAGPGFAALDTALSAADERAKGSGWARSLAKGATVAAGGALGGTLGAIGGGGLGSAALGLAGASAGGAAAGKAFDVAAGANARERKAMATANRQRQAGTAVKGIGGQTTFSQKKPGGPAFMSTGVGKQRKTVELAKTGVVQRGGQSTAGHIAFKGGKAVYKAGPSAQSLAKTSSNPLERIGRSLFAGAYKKHDTMKAQQALQKARASDAARNKKLGVKAKPAG